MRNYSEEFDFFDMQMIRGRLDSILPNKMEIGDRPYILFPRALNAFHDMCVSIIPTRFVRTDLDNNVKYKALTDTFFLTYEPFTRRESHMLQHDISLLMDDYTLDIFLYFVAMEMSQTEKTRRYLREEMSGVIENRNWELYRYLEEQGFTDYDNKDAIIRAQIEFENNPAVFESNFNGVVKVFAPKYLNFLRRYLDDRTIPIPYEYKTYTLNFVNKKDNNITMNQDETLLDNSL